MIASAVAAGFAGIMVVVKMGFRRVFGALSPKKRARDGRGPGRGEGISPTGRRSR